MTRNCPESDIMPFTVSSFFSSRFELLPGLTAYHHRQQSPATAVLTLIDTGVIEEKLENREGKEHLLELLSPEEKKLFATYSYPKRQKEWLAGRFACKYAVLLLLDETFSHQQFPTFSVLPGKRGSPELFFPENPLKKPSVSISHSGKYAAAMAGFAASCGLDIQKVTAKIMNVISRFAAPEEIKLLETGTSNMDEQERLTLLWSAKEAIKKSLLHDQPVIFKGVTLQRLSTEKVTSLWLSSSLDEPKTAEVTAFLLGDYALAFTTSGVNHA